MVWQPPLIKTIATSGQGTPELHRAVLAHRQFLVDQNLWDEKNAARLTAELERSLREELYHNWQQKVDPRAYREMLKLILSHQISPQKAAIDLLNQPKSTK